MAPIFFNFQIISAKKGLGEVLSWKIVARNLRRLKVNVKKLISLKKSELENWWENIWCSRKFKLKNWYQKLLSRRISIYEKIFQSWKIGIKHFELENWCKTFQCRVGKFCHKFLSRKIGFEKLVSV